MILYIYTAINWYRVSLFKELNKKCKCKFIIINDYKYHNTDYSDIKFTPDLSQLDIVFLDMEGSKFENLCKIIDKLEFRSLITPSMNGVKNTILSLRLAKYYKNKGKQILYFWEYWPIESYQATLKRKGIQLIRNLIVKTASKYVDCFLTPSTYTLAYYLSLDIPSYKIVKMPNASELDYSKKDTDRQAIRIKFNIKDTDVVILYFGRLEEYKGIRELVMAFNILNCSNTYLLICGSGRLNYNINNKNVIYTGSIPANERCKYFSAADIFILPNNYNGKNEAWGLTVNEAMHFSLPVIVTNATGASFDLVWNNINGYVINSNNLTNELVKKLKLLIVDKDKRRQMGSNSKRIIENYTFENMASVIGFCSEK